MKLTKQALVAAAAETIAALELPVTQARSEGPGPKKRAPLRKKGMGWEGTRDLAQLEAWFTESPGHDQIGACLDGSRFVVLDVDWHDELGALGWESLDALCVEAGLAGGVEALAGSTASARTPGGGTHLWFLEPAHWSLHSERKIAVRPKLDMLCGGFVMLPPSCPSGRRDEPALHYRWVRSPLAPGASAAVGPDLEAEGVPIVELPAALADVLVRAVERRERLTKLGVDGSSGAGSSAEAVARREHILEHGSESGQRNNDLVELVGWLRRKIGDTPAAHLEIRALIEQWRDRCQPPYRGDGQDEEVERSWLSALAQPHLNEYAELTWPLTGIAVQQGAGGMDAAGLESLDHQGLATFLEPYAGPALVWERESERVFYYDRRGVWVPDDGAGVGLYAALESSVADGGYGAVEALRNAVQAEMDVANGAGDRGRVRELRSWYTRAIEPQTLLRAARTVAGRKREGRSVDRLSFDAASDWLTVRNGWVNLTTGAVISHEDARARGWRNVCLADVPYDPLARSALWDHTLELMLPGDPEMQAFLQRALGASLFADNRAKACFVLHGETNNGKSTLLNILRGVLGDGYAAVGAREVFVEARGKGGSASEKHLTGLADAMDHRLLWLPEFGENDQLNSDTIKQLTGNDLIQVRRMRQDHYMAEPRCTPWILSNHRVHLGSFSEAIMRRVKLIELPGEIPVEHRKDASRVLAEHRADDVREAVLAWLVAGARAYCEQGLNEPQRMVDALAEMEAEQNPLHVWLDELVEQGAVVTPWAQLTNPELGTQRRELYERHVARAGKYALGEQRFGREMAQLLQRMGAGPMPSGKDGVRFRVDGSTPQRFWPIALPQSQGGWDPRG